jgi:hypothetical protein
MPDQEDTTNKPTLVELQALDPASFRVPAKDGKGHDERIWVRIQPGHIQAMEAFVQSRKFPYRSIPELVRHAIFRHLHWLNNLGPVRSVTGAVDAILALLREDEFMAEFKQVLETMDARVYLHLNQGETNQARRIVLETLRHVKDMPEGFWKDKYVKTIEEKFSQLLKDAPKASLVNFSKED